MRFKKFFIVALAGAAGLALAAGSVLAAKESKPAQGAGQPEMQLPPGWTEEDMQAVMLAGTPGDMQARLAKDVGTWRGKMTMWMIPGAEPVVTDCSSTITSIMDGRYTRIETASEMPGMGPFTGLGVNGFDNVSQKFVSTWIDNHSTGILTGEGKLSGDGKAIEWEFSYNCPLTKKPSAMRQIETIGEQGTKTLDMFGADPKSGKEFHMMHLELSRQ
ncbi:MAG: DUF1579 family protein [Candidatus Hydrogenedentes bacterium]|nr:DUF1579 family protein [Candidatus Hydrogenedentota bacterium]